VERPTRPAIHTRRDALRLLSGGVGATFGLGLLSSCTETQGDQVVVVDSYYESGDGRQAMLDALAATPFADSVQIGTTNRETFTSSIEGYLATQPGTVFTWSAGYELSALIRTGGIQEVSSVWNAADLNPRLRRLASDPSGVQYLVPLWFDPWGLFYSRTDWVDAGYAVPASPEDLIGLSERMALDGVAAFGISRLATPALMALYDYINIAMYGVIAHRRPIVDGALDDKDFANREAVFGVIRSLAEAEVALGNDAPVSIVPAMLSEAATRAGSDEDLGCFVLDPSVVIAQSEGFLLAVASPPNDSEDSRELLNHLASIGPQQAFLGNDSSILPANLNANYQGMSPTMLKMVEIIDKADTIAEVTEVAPLFVVTELVGQLTEIVRPS
jgi:multiple sugar transport system substrate-binding protein